MAYDVRMSVPARDEFNDAVTYIAERLASPRAMQAMVNEFEVAVSALETNPFAYPIDQAVSQRVGQTVRKIRVKNYLVFYRIKEEARRVEIISFLHMRQDIGWHIARDIELF